MKTSQNFVHVAVNVLWQRYHIFQSFSIKIFEYAQYLHSGQRNGSLSHNSISNLVLKIASIFGSKVANVFNVSPANTQVEIADMVRHEWKMHQLKEILESL